MVLRKGLYDGLHKKGRLCRIAEVVVENGRSWNKTWLIGHENKIRVCVGGWGYCNCFVDMAAVEITSRMGADRDPEGAHQ